MLQPGANPNQKVHSNRNNSMFYNSKKSNKNKAQSGIKFVKTTKINPLKYKARLIFSLLYFSKRKIKSLNWLAKTTCIDKRTVKEILKYLQEVELIDADNKPAKIRPDWFYWCETENYGDISYFRIFDVHNPLKNSKLKTKGSALLAKYFGVSQRTIQRWKVAKDTPATIATPKAQQPQPGLVAAPAIIPGSTFRLGGPVLASEQNHEHEAKAECFALMRQNNIATPKQNQIWSYVKLKLIDVNCEQKYRFFSTGYLFGEKITEWKKTFNSEKGSLASWIIKNLEDMNPPKRVVIL